jgi:hypothetical protein
VESEVVIDFRLAFTQEDIEKLEISLEGLTDIPHQIPLLSNITTLLL